MHLSGLAWASLGFVRSPYAPSLVKCRSGVPLERANPGVSPGGGTSITRLCHEMARGRCGGAGGDGLPPGALLLCPSLQTGTVIPHRRQHPVESHSVPAGVALSRSLPGRLLGCGFSPPELPSPPSE